MRKILLEISYDGTNYCGWQRQENLPSVQENIENCLLKITKEKINIHASGRTDAKVHALAQVAHFSTSARMPADRFAIALNMLLPEDIRINLSKEVDESFHARFSAKKKHYKYLINNSRVYSPMTRNFELHIHAKLDIELMQKAAKSFIGEHDFGAFMSIHCPQENHVRKIYSSELKILDNINNNSKILEYNIVGSGFLRHMVRIIMGTIIDVGMHRKSLDCVTQALETQNRNLAGATALAHGLTLVEVEY